MTTPRDRPWLIYDGDCGFCRYWVRYWLALTGDRVIYAPYQEVGQDFPDIRTEQFQQSIQFVEPDGRISSGAEASYRTLAQAPGYGFWFTLYRTVPGFAWITERAYAFIARHRIAFGAVSRWLWGPRLEPARYDRLARLFLRLLGLIYLAAYISFGVQVLGLVGSQGILPLTEHLDDLRSLEERWIPTVFWLDASDRALQVVCGLGAVLAVLVVLNVMQRAALVLLYVLYLSLVDAGQIFTHFQWDTQLLEAGFLAIFLTPRAPVTIWLYRWFIFRFMLLGGAVKLLSGDPAWPDLTALHYHFETQPLPSPLAWSAHHLADGITAALTATTLFIECVIAFFVFLPRRLRFFAAWSFIFLQIAIVLTGNYGFFNLLTLALCLPLFDDAALRSVSGWRRETTAKSPGVAPLPRSRSRLLGVVGFCLVGLSTLQLWEFFSPRSFPATLLTPVFRYVAPFHIVNIYGPFAVMTRTRPEIIVEGSDDGVKWKPYVFRYKPGDLNRPPIWNIPHQPRLDWQMWFAALNPAGPPWWFDRFIDRLKDGSPAVLGLLADDPFPTRPPSQIRAWLYDYRFTDPATRKTSSQWWDRERIGRYYP